MAWDVSNVFGISLIPGIEAPLVMRAIISAKVGGYGADCGGEGCGVGEADEVDWPWAFAGFSIDVCSGTGD